MINPSFFLGYNVPFKNICYINPPKVKDVIGNKNYAIYRKILTTSQEDLEDEYTESKKSIEDMPTPFEYLFLLYNSSEVTRQYVKDAFKFFIGENVTFLNEQKIIIIGDLEEVLKTINSVEDLRIINEDIFFEFQNAIRACMGEKTIEAYNPDENPKVKYFKAKARLRDRVKAKSKDTLTLGTSLAAICCMNFGLNPLNIGELSWAAVPVLMRYYQEKDKYEIDIQSLLAGADKNKVKPRFWIRNIEDL